MATSCAASVHDDSLSWHAAAQLICAATTSLTTVGCPSQGMVFSDSCCVFNGCTILWQQQIVGHLVSLHCLTGAGVVKLGQHVQHLLWDSIVCMKLQLFCALVFTTLAQHSAAVRTGHAQHAVA